MSIVVEGIRIAGARTAVAVGATVVAAVTPLVSLVAVPIFALSALPKWIEHSILYNKTLTNQTREKFGRVPGQDYTRWDGKAIHKPNTPATESERIHELMDAYLHGAPNDSLKNPPADCPFKSAEDAKWLNLEFKRREKKDLLESDLKMLRAFAKALIPVFGLLWILRTETNVGGASELGCRGCMMGGVAEDAHWGWREAITFHNDVLEKRLPAQKPGDQV